MSARSLSFIERTKFYVEWKNYYAAHNGVF